MASDIAPDRPRARQQLRAGALVCTAAAGILALIGMAGWVFEEPLLTRLHSGYATMKFDTALMLLLIAIAQLLDLEQLRGDQPRGDQPRGDRPRGRPAARACAAVAGVVAAVVVLEYASGHGLGIDQLLYTDHGAGPHPGRPSLATAVALLLIAATYVPQVARRRYVTQTVSLVLLSVSALAALGYAYGVPSLYSVHPGLTVAVHTATAVGLLAIARLLTVERGVAVWVHAGVNPGATLMRIVVPSAVIGLPLVGYACVLARRHELFTDDAAIALIVLLCVLALIAASWAAGVVLDRVDRRRRRALDELHALADDLERQVAERSNQVQKGRDELVLLADRQRIAADLHDVVVQRLFAAGMTLNSVDPTTVTGSVGGRIDEAVEAMDAAIKDLRASIFELSRPVATSADLLTTLDGVCIEAARVLGFEPDLVVDDPDDEAEQVRADVLAVVREALANVARHARAGAACVTLRSDGAAVTLTVADDGIGMTQAPHSSGTRNMQERAERRGGTCTWSPVEPHGTAVVWQVPSTSTSTPTAGQVAAQR